MLHKFVVEDVGAEPLGELGLLVLFVGTLVAPDPWPEIWGAVPAGNVGAD